MFCNRCGSQQVLGTVFCGNCGARLPAQAARPEATGNATPQIFGTPGTASVGPRRKVSRRQKRNLAIAIVAVVVVGLGLIVANIILSSRYGPSKPVLAYISALQHHNALAAFDQLAPQQAGVASNFSAYLLTRDGIAKQLSSNSLASVPSDPTLVSVKMGSGGSNASVDVAYTLAGQRLTTTYQVQKIEGQSNALFYPVWKMTPPIATLQISTPSSVSSVLVNNIPVSVTNGSASVAVLPGRSRVVMNATVLLYGGSQTASPPQPGDTASVRFAAKVLPSAIASANKALDAAFAQCATSTSLSPSNCPFSDSQGYGSQVTNVIWEEGAAPSTTANWTLSSRQGVLQASGSLPMSVTYLVTTPGLFGSPAQETSQTDQVEAQYDATATPNGSSFSIEFNNG